MATQWFEARFPMLVNGENGPEQIFVAGWSNGIFGIDERENMTILREKRRGKVWCVTHIPTGYAMKYMIGSKRIVQMIADIIMQAADWDFSDPAEAKRCGPVVKAVMQEHPRKFIDSFDAGPPCPVEEAPNG